MKHLLHFVKLGLDGDLAIRLPEMSREVILMVMLRAIKLGEGNDFRHDGGGENTGRIELLLVVLRQTLLLVGVKENHRTILRPHVIALAIQRCRVMRLPNDLEQFFERDRGRVIRDLSRLGVSGRAGANLLAHGILHRAAAKMAPTVDSRLGLC
jgi:hypothetical protein